MDKADEVLSKEAQEAIKLLALEWRDIRREELSAHLICLTMAARDNTHEVMRVLVDAVSAASVQFANDNEQKQALQAVGEFLIDRAEAI